MVEPAQTRVWEVVVPESAIDEAIKVDITTGLWLLVVAFGAMMVVRRTKLPYTIALVVAGFVIGSTHLLRVFHLSYELVFALFLPPLLFDAAIRLPVAMLKRNWKIIALLAVPGVIASTLLVAYATHYWAGLALPLALLFGALISATDPISVLALFKSVGVEKRLSILVEGESLFNDGTAAVLYASFVAAMVAGRTLDAGDIGFGFVKAIAGGALVGGGIGWAISLVMARIDDHLVEITLTTIAAYGAVMTAEAFGTSGIISVISSGIVLGYYRSEAAMSATTRAAVYSFWEYIAFVVNSFLFLLIGIDVAIRGIIDNIIPVLVAIGVVIAARTIVVYTTGAALSRSTSRIPLKWQHVLNWGGLRGAIAIALALGLPRTLGPARDVVLAMTYGVVLWTLLPQGLSIGWFLKRLGLAGREEAEEAYGRIVAETMANRASLDELARLEAEIVLPKHVHDELAEKIQAEISDLERQRYELHQEHGAMLEDQLSKAKLRLLAARHNAVRRAEEMGLVSGDTARDLIARDQEEYGNSSED